MRLWLRFQPIGLTGSWVEAYGPESRFAQIFKLKVRRGWEAEKLIAHRLELIALKKILKLIADG